MTEQWFLDLDGVRSGPYQTPEVMSLVAEGEVLPHHRIATGLSAQNWITILDWRLDQAKLNQKTRPQAPASSRSEISTVEFGENEKTRDDLKTLSQQDLSHFTEQRVELEIPKPEPIKAEPVKVESAKVGPIKNEPVKKAAVSSSTSSAISSLVPPTHSAVSSPAGNPIPVTASPPAAATTPTAATPPLIEKTNPAIKRPAEIKASEPGKSAAVSPAQPPHTSAFEKPEPTLTGLKRELEQGLPKELPKSAKGSGNTALIKRPGAALKDEPAASLADDETAPSEAASRPRRDPMAEMFDVLQKTKQKREAKQNTGAANGISIEQDVGSSGKGFNLGRTLMIGGGITLIGFALGQVFQQQATPPHETAASATPKPVSTPAATPHSTTQVVDRSTDKLTIRGVVDRKPDPTPARNQAKAPQHTNSPTTTQAAENPQTEKELEELRNLKKELQELKNLKNSADEQPVVDPEGGDFDAVDPNGNPQGNPGGENPGGQGVSNPGEQQPLNR